MISQVGATKQPGEIQGTEMGIYGKQHNLWPKLWLAWGWCMMFPVAISVQAQEKTNARTDTTRLGKPAATIQTDTLRQKPIVVPPPKLDEAYIDSAQDLFENQDLTIPTPEDTTGKIRLPIDRRKTKFAYFDATQSIDRLVPNHAFAVGEKLSFLVRYGPIVAGTASMSIPQITKIRNREVYKIVTQAQSSAFFSAFYKVRDRVESYVDRTGLYSWRFEKHLREGNYSADRIVDYDHFSGWAVTNKKDSMRIPTAVQDILSSFYYIRTQKLEVGKSLFIDNHSDNKLYPLEVKVHKKERVTVKAGTFDCYVVEPILRASGLFKSKGRLLIWLTADHRKIPVQMKSKIPIGYITAELKETEGIVGAEDVGVRGN